MHNALTSGNAMGKDPYCISYKTLFRHISIKLHEELAKAEIKEGEE
jgi:hypothetical protein